MGAHQYITMSTFLVLLAAAASSALPQYPGPFNTFPQFRPTFQNFPQQLTNFQFPQVPLPNIGSLPAWFNSNQMVGGQASLPPWLKPQADATKDPAESAAEDVAAAPAEDVAAAPAEDVAAVRYIDNTKD